MTLGKSEDPKTITFEVTISSCDDYHFQCPYFKSFKGMKLQRRCSKKKPHKVFRDREWLNIPDWCPLLKED